MQRLVCYVLPLFLKPQLFADYASETSDIEQPEQFEKQVSICSRDSGHRISPALLFCAMTASRLLSYRSQMALFKCNGLKSLSIL